MFRGWKNKEKPTKETDKEQTVRERENQKPGNGAKVRTENKLNSVLNGSG